ncbi:MAG TPA: hypothetical protein VMA30_14680 [Xanthobacteraceae bacterium]|nr:hypothetical protein [Xanthobacteraceae bacterium]
MLMDILGVLNLTRNATASAAASLAICSIKGENRSTLSNLM